MFSTSILTFLCLIFSLLDIIFANTVIKLNHTDTTIYTTTCGTYSYYEVHFPFACEDLIISVNPIQGEPNIYVSYDISQPSKYDLTWSANAVGEYSVKISHWDPESSIGTYYFSVYDDCSVQGNDAKYTISAISDNSDNVDDLYLHPLIGRNQVVGQLDYTYFKFCIPETYCSNFKVTLENCLDNSICPQAYSYPELLVTRNIPEPTIFDYSFKLAQIVRRFVSINTTDASARDRHNSFYGSYYAGVYGWCTPDEYVVNNATDGPCSYIKNVLFNVTLSSEPSIGSVNCSPAPLPLPPVPRYEEIVDNQDYTGSVACNEYKYYTINITNPCESVVITAQSTTNLDITAAELAVGKYPVVEPTFKNLEWTSYNWGLQNLTIDAFDPNFDGGYICGPDKKSICQLYIGVTGYCSTNQTTHVNYTLNVQFENANNIFQTPQLQQNIQPQTYNRYQFCYTSDVDITAQLLTWTNPLICPSKYTDLDLIISRTNRYATSSDIVWRVPASNTGPKEILLFANNTDVRAGTYYLNVYGNCIANNECNNFCTCAPCSNLANSEYAVYVNEVSPLNLFDTDLQTYLGNCQEQDTNVCILGESQNPNVSVDQVLKSQTFIVAVTVGIILAFVVGSILGCSIIYILKIREPKASENTSPLMVSYNNVLQTQTAPADLASI